MSFRKRPWWNGRHAGFRFQFRKECGFKSHRAHQAESQKQLIHRRIHMKNMLLAAAAALCAGVFAQQSEIARWDPNMAQNTAVVDKAGVKWIDGRNLPLEGRMFDDVDAYYDRLPSNVTKRVNGGVRSSKHHSSGMMFRFRTDSRQLSFKWTPYNRGLSMDHMPSTGVSGIDVYRFDEAKGRWLYVKTGRIHDAVKGGALSLPWKPGDACTVNLPLYNGIRSFSLGIDGNAKVEALGPRRSGIDKPVVFYGTSITHGGCCSRPGLAFVNRVGRELDVPVVGLGFSGSGVMELEMSEHLARIDASCYVLDCLWNMGTRDGQPRRGRNVEDNYEPSIRNLRAKRPGVPTAQRQGPLHQVALREAREGGLEGSRLSPEDEHVSRRHGGHG